MTTLEKLFVQIFERKNSIIEQVKHQTDLYSQHLASKLIIDGIPPPPWLWNPNFNSETSNLKGVKKEELISQLLLPHQRSAVPFSGAHCSLYNKQIVGDNAELSEGSLKETHVANKGFNTGNGRRSVPECQDSDTGSGCALNCVPKMGLSATSPRGQVEASILNIYTASDQSLARIHRSKSRQKAIELRKIAKSAPKICSTNENDGVSSRRIEMSRITSQQLVQDADLLVLTDFAGITNDNGAVRGTKGECLRKEKDATIYHGRMTRFRSSCNLSSRDSKPLELLNSSDIGKEDGARMTRSQSSCLEGESKPIHSSCNADQRVIPSRSGVSNQSLLSNSLNRLEGFGFQNVSGGEVIPDSLDSNDNVNREGKSGCGAETEQISDGTVQARAGCVEYRLDTAGVGVGLEVCVSSTPSDCSMFVKPKALDFDDAEMCILNDTFNPMLDKERLDKSSEKRCNLLKSASSLDRLTLGDPSDKSLENCSLERVVSDKTTEASSVSIDNCMEECVEVCEKDEAFDVEMHQKVKSNTTEGLEFLPKHQVEPVELGSDGRDRSEKAPSAFKHQQLEPSIAKHSTEDQGCQVGELVTTDPSSIVFEVKECFVEDNKDSVSVENKLDKGNMSGLSRSERTFLERKSYGGEDGLLACGSVGSLHGQDKNSGASETRELQLLEKCSLPGRRLRSSTEDSWPQFKRRKIWCQKTNMSATPYLGVKEIHNIGGCTMTRFVRGNLETPSQCQGFPVTNEGNVVQSNADESADVEIPWKVNYHLAQGTVPLPELELVEDEPGSEERYNSTNTPSISHRAQLGLSFVSSLTKEAAGDSIGSMENVGPEDTTSTVLDLMECDEKNPRNSLHSENNVAIEIEDDLTHTERILLETKSHFTEDDLSSHCSVLSAQDKHLASVRADQTMPEFEGFMIDEEVNEQPYIVGEANSSDKLDLLRTTIERASVLEQLCKSASMHTPLSQFSTTFKLYGTPSISKSVPHGLLGHIDLMGILSLNGEGCKQQRASYSCVDEVECAFQGVSHPDSVPDTDAHFGWRFQKPQMSPVGKVGDRILSNSSSAEQQWSLNPELTCFPIEEDPSNSGENENGDEVANVIQEDICSAMMSRGAAVSKREPLADITESCVNHPTPVCAAERRHDRSSLDSVNSEVCFTGTHDAVKQKLRSRYSNKGRCTNEAKENHTSSMSSNPIKKATQSLNNRYSKPIVPGKPSLRKGGQSLSERESKHNNIVSNISSFVPLIQRKQAAAVSTVKRDIKVKALEAAEAAKRLEEKIRNERKKKKEALVLERAKIEQVKLRQMESKKKTKEEEKKKKVTDVSARKRTREEEERMEKERKRRRMEARWPHRAQEEALCLKKMEKKVSSGAITTNVLTKTVQNDNFVAKTNQEKSYEISPYQCSDDEEDDEDGIATKKFIPSWASKNSVAVVLSSQQKNDADMIFFPGSFCSMDEVLRPR